MRIRRVQFNIEYVHILTFKEEYKSVIIPFFGSDSLRYAVDDENTIHESIRLFFDADSLFISVRKDGISFIFEGDSERLMKPSGLLRVVWEIYDRIKELKGYKKTVRYTLVVHGVNIVDKTRKDVINIISKKWHNPFPDLNEIGCLYEWKNKGNSIKFQFGNFSKRDIKVHDLKPFSTDYNDDLEQGEGFIARYEDQCQTDVVSHSKFKEALIESNDFLSNFYDRNLNV